VTFSAVCRPVVAVLLSAWDRAGLERAKYAGGASQMHYSRLCALPIDSHTSDVDATAGRGNSRMLETPPDEQIVEIPRVEHERRVHINIETDGIAAKVARLENLGAGVVDRPARRVVMPAPTGQRFCTVRAQRPGFSKNANRRGQELFVRFAEI